MNRIMKLGKQVVLVAVVAAVAAYAAASFAVKGLNAPNLKVQGVTQFIGYPPQPCNSGC